MPAHNDAPLTLYFIDEISFDGDDDDLQLFVWAANPSAAAKLWRSHFSDRKLSREPDRIWVVPTAQTTRARALPWNDCEGIVQAGGAS